MYALVIFLIEDRKMAYINFDVKDIKPGVVFVSKKELMARTGVPKSTMHGHIVKDKVDAFRFRNRTYFNSDVADEYEMLVKTGLLG
jgi:hypothetical protein